MTTLPSAPVLVLEIGAEGGCIRVFRDTVKPDPKSQFLATLLDHTPLLLDESEGGGNEIRRDSGWVSWADAMTWIGRYPWPFLRALKVDRSVADAVWISAEQYLHEKKRPIGGSEEQWRRLCGRPDGRLPKYEWPTRESTSRQAVAPPPAMPPTSHQRRPGDSTGVPETRQKQIRALIELGREQGYLTYAQINKLLPADLVDTEQIEDIVNTFNDMGISVFESAP